MRNTLCASRQAVRVTTSTTKKSLSSVWGTETPSECLHQFRKMPHSCKRRSSNASSLDAAQSPSAHRRTLTPREKTASPDHPNRRLPSCCCRVGRRARSRESDSSEYGHCAERKDRNSGTHYLKTSEHRMGFGIVFRCLEKSDFLGLH